MYEKVILVGRLTADPEMRYSPNGDAVTNFSIAIDDDYTPQGGTKVERTKFVRISCWGKVAENVNQYKHKGDPVLIEGALTGEWVTGTDGKQTCNGPKAWQAKDQTWHASFEVRAFTVKFLPSPKPVAGTPAAQPSNVSSSTNDPDGTGIPF